MISVEMLLFLEEPKFLREHCDKPKCYNHEDQDALKTTPGQSSENISVSITVYFKKNQKNMEQLQHDLKEDVHQKTCSYLFIYLCICYINFLIVTETHSWCHTAASFMALLSTTLCFIPWILHKATALLSLLFILLFLFLLIFRLWIAGSRNTLEHQAAVQFHPQPPSSALAFMKL